MMVKKYIKLLACIMSILTLCAGTACTAPADRLILCVSAAGIYNVMDYGAAGDNITDDSEAIAEAINAAASDGGGTVYFPKGNYLVKRSFSLSSDIKIEGALGAAIKLDAPDLKSLFTAENAENICISGITALSESREMSVLAFSGAENIRISNNTVTGMALVSNGSNSSGILIEGNRLYAENFSGNAAELYNCSNIQIRNNLAEGYGLSFRLNNCDAQLSQNTLSDGGIEADGLKNSEIKGNIMSCKISLMNSENCIIFANNIITDGEGCVALTENNRNIKISGNTLRSTECGTVILKVGGTAVKNKLIYISQNQLSHEMGTDGLKAGEGISFIELSDTYGLTVDSNYINNISLNIDSNSGANISGNMLYTENSISGSKFTALSAALTGNNVINGNSIRINKGMASYSVGAAITLNDGNAVLQNNSVYGFTQELKLNSDTSSKMIIKNNVLQKGLIDCAGAAPSSLVCSQNRTQNGSEVKLTQLTSGVAEGTRYMDIDADNSVGKIFRDGEWYSFDEIGIKARMLVLTQEGNLVNALFEAENLREGNALIIAVYNSENALIKISVVDVPKDDTSGILKQSVQLEEPEYEYLVKAFVWSTVSDMLPIYDVKELQAVTEASE